MYIYKHRPLQPLVLEPSYDAPPVVPLVAAAPPLEELAAEVELLVRGTLAKEPP